MDTESLAHTQWNCKYHIVFAPKYRRRVIYDKIKSDIGKILRTLCDYKKVEILEANACPDHIHMLVSIPPKMSVSSFMGYLKGKSSLKLCEIAEIPTFKERKTALYDCSEAIMLNYGYLAYAKLWEVLGIANCMRSIQEKSKIQFPLSETAFLMAVQHLLCPRSKLSTYEHQDNYYNLKEAELQYLYRTLDKLCEEKESVESQLFEQNYKISGQKVDVVFYDVTTFAFESVIVDELRNFGFSKDCKFKEVQVVMGLLIDINGCP